MGRSRVKMSSCSSGVVLVAALACITTPAQAQGVCVICNEPEAVYRCQPDASAGGGLRVGDARLNLLCITELARAGGHASCSVRRQQTGNCDGLPRTVVIAPAPEVPIAGSGEAATPPPPGKRGPPDTVAEMAKRTADSSKEQLDKATGAVGNVAKKTGDAVGDAAKKTGNLVGDAAKKSWNCLASLFKDC